MLVEHVDDDAAVVAAVDRGAEGSPGVTADPAAEDDLHVVRAADVKIAGDQGLKETAGLTRCVEHDGAGHLDLAHRDLPPVPRIMVPGGEWQR
jgi:hypothetical protein